MALPTAASAGGATDVSSRAVTFTVRNVNGSLLRCASDGATYRIRGHLVAPRARANGARSTAVTLYLHEFSFGEFFWNFRPLKRLNYAVGQAKAGHSSVVIDRLGYGRSDRPQGDLSCLGAQADVVHQIVGQLKAGTYSLTGGSPRAFKKVALVGHSLGAQIATIEAYSFADVDALVSASYAPQVSPRAFQQFYRTREVCLAGGEPAGPNGPAGYAYYGQSVSDFVGNVFQTAPRGVVRMITRLRARDPCGDSGSLVEAIQEDFRSLGKIRVPVLIVCGTRDTIIPLFGCRGMKRRYSGTRDVSVAAVPGSGHALTFERSAPVFRKTVSRWLRKLGL